MDFLDEITLTGLRVFGRHGVYDDERRDGQDFIVDATLLRQHGSRAASDDVADTVHYGEVARAHRRDRRGRAGQSDRDARGAHRRCAARRGRRAHGRRDRPQAAAPRSAWSSRTCRSRSAARGRTRGSPQKASAAHEPPPRRRALGRHHAPRPAAGPRRGRARREPRRPCSDPECCACRSARACRWSTTCARPRPSSRSRSSPTARMPTAPGYLNAVALVTTRLAPSVLLAFLHAIETRHGRERRERWGDRTLDLDLIAYGDVISDRRRADAAAPACGRAGLRARALARDRSGCRARPAHGRVDELLAQLRGSRVKRTGAGILIIAARARRRRGVPARSGAHAPAAARRSPPPSRCRSCSCCSERSSWRSPCRSAGRPRGTLAAPVNPFRALRIAMLAKASSIVGAAVGGPRRRPRAVPADPPRAAVGRLDGGHRRDRVCGAALVVAGLVAGTSVHDPEG